MSRVQVIVISLLIGCASSAIADSRGHFTRRGSVEDYNRSCPIANDANNAMRLDRYEEAVRLYKRAISIYPHDSGHYMGLGVALRKTGQLEASIVAEKKAIELEPGYVNAWLSLGVCYEKQKRFVEAERCYRKAVQLDPEEYDAVGSLGDILRQQGRFAEARKYLLRAKDLPKSKEFPGEIDRLLTQCDQQDARQKSDVTAPPKKQQDSGNWDDLYK